MDTWDVVLQLAKDTVNREPDIRPGATVGSVGYLALFKMALAHPGPEDIDATAFAPTEVHEYGDDHNTYF